MDRRILLLASALSLAGCGDFLRFGSFDSSGAPESGYGGSSYGSTPYEPPYPPYPSDPSDPSDPSNPAKPTTGDDASTADGGTGPDAASGADAGTDPVLPSWPLIDAAVGAPDRTGCTDGAPATGYVMSESGALSRFDPSTFTATVLGTPACPAAADAWPFDMAATHSGTLYVLYTDWNIYAIDPASLSCLLTPWTAGQLDFSANVGFAVQRVDGVEALAVTGLQPAPLGDAYHATFGRADLATMTLSVVGTTPIVAGAPSKLQSDVYNRLFQVDGGSVVRLDPGSGAVLGVDAIPGYVRGAGDNSTGMVMGQNVYAFSTGETDATIYRYDLVSKTTTAIVQLQSSVSAATAVPCSP